MKKILLFGIIAAILFSSTFTINHALYGEQGTDWYWIASLRYLFVFLILSLLFTAIKGVSYFKEILVCYTENWRFWTVAGGVGFGLFYLPLCYAVANKMSISGWVEAVVWQFTIIASPIIFLAMGKKISKFVVGGLALISLGILMVLFSQFEGFTSNAKVYSIFAVIFASFCYPLGNTLCKYACEGKYEKYRLDKYAVTKNPFGQILLMTMGAAPIFILAGLIHQPQTIPSFIDIRQIGIVAVVSGILATGIFYKARQLAKNSTSKLAIADATQAFEVPAAVLLGTYLGAESAPDAIGWVGLSLVVIGIWLFSYFNNNKETDHEEENQLMSEELPEIEDKPLPLHI